MAATDRTLAYGFSSSQLRVKYSTIFGIHREHNQFCNRKTLIDVRFLLVTKRLKYKNSIAQFIKSRDKSF